VKSDQAFNNIPCNIITGFLGVGKTTAIQYLLKHKPATQRWAVLVNEFGQVGLDAELIEGDVAREKPAGASVYIKEIPGGCMCCSAGLPMAVALNQLIKEAKPDRLLIEPTGLGHPKEVLKVLNGDNYKDVLDVQNTLTILDARHFNDDRYLKSPVYKQQLSVADVFIFNKSDEASEQDKSKANDYLEDHDFGSVKTVDVVNGEIAQSLLFEKVTKPATKEIKKGFSFLFKALDAHTLDNESVDDCSGFQRFKKIQDGFTSWGWVFEADNKDNFFDLTEIERALKGFSSLVLRIKAVIYSQDQCLYVNIQQADESLTRDDLDGSDPSNNTTKIEIIAQADVDFEKIESAILGCRRSASE